MDHRQPITLAVDQDAGATIVAPIVRLSTGEASQVNLDPMKNGCPQGHPFSCIFLATTRSVPLRQHSFWALNPCHRRQTIKLELPYRIEDRFRSHAFGIDVPL